ncbi:MAG: ABC transporter substrate-binding protein, partial [Duncaniella sp.]|nr:ABC transporter substrate-binding protein [Duncaniella sp.]
AGEEVLHDGVDDDIWLFRFGQTTDKTLRELSADNPLYGQFKAFKLKNVYGCNTEKINYYEQTPFHPHWLLHDLIRVIHPEVLDGDTVNRYFTPLK